MRHHSPLACGLNHESDGTDIVTSEHGGFDRQKPRSVDLGDDSHRSVGVPVRLVPVQALVRDGVRPYDGDRDYPYSRAILWAA